MNTKPEEYRYMEWFDAQEMHERTKNWFSELSFVKDEQRFLNQLIESFASKPIDTQEFAQMEDFKKAIAQNQWRLNPIFKQVQKHMNQLDIMVDDVNQLEMEKAYRKTHRKLFQNMNQYLLDYRTVKERGLKKLSSILKRDKKIMAIGNPEYQLKTTIHEK